MALAYIALGSNLGDREQTLREALVRVEALPDTEVVRVSTLRETAPVGGPAGQAPYLNGVAQITTRLEPLPLLGELLAIEAELGRVRSERFGPRTLDLDLLLYDDAIVRTEELALPHPRLHLRRFVLEPLAEIAPLALHPELQSTASDLLRRLREKPLFGQTAVVTGSTSGIGRAIALRLAADGASVVVHGRRSAARAQEVADQCQQLAGLAHVLLADVREEAQCLELVEKAWALAPIDIWVNNAGADILTGEAHRWTFERKLQELWRVDVQATMILARAVGARMKARGGVILNIGWDQAESGMEGDSGELFAATKGAVMAFTRSLALSLAPSVRVNCIAPGWIRTAWGEGASSAWQERVLRETPLRRWGTPEDIARAAVWLVSPDASYLTGQILRANGGAVR